MRLKTRFTYILLITSFISCTKSISISENSFDRLIERAALEIKSPFKYYLNETGEYILFVHTPNTPGELFNLEYTVLSTESSQVLYPASKIYGEVRWVDNEKLKLIEYPRVLKDADSTNENNITFINIKSLQTENQ
jgi:hypothetical protein